MTSRLELEESVREDDRTGRIVRRFAPVFTPDVTASGRLRFAIWEAWEDEPDTHNSQRDKALANARACLRAFADGFSLDTREG